MERIQQGMAGRPWWKSLGFHTTVTVTDMVKKAKWRAREGIGNREGKVMAEAISEDRITLDDMLNALKDAKRQGRPSKYRRFSSLTANGSDGSQGQFSAPDFS